MTDTNNSLRNIVPTITSQETNLQSLLDPQDFAQLASLKQELEDTWTKKQIFRTETEMRVSVLNDGKFPTPAAKYWQCVREQNVFFENLIQLSFNYRKNLVEIKKLERKIANETDDLEVELLQIELEEKQYARANMELVAKDRVREMEHWSRIKSELDDGSFDNKNVNTHQMTSLRMTLQNRAKALTSGSSQAEVINVLGPLETANRLVKQQQQQLESAATSALLEEMSPNISRVSVTESVAVKANE
jgi:hypothetical protein